MAKKRKGSHVTAKTGFYTYDRRGKFLTGSFRHSTCSTDHSQKVSKCSKLRKDISLNG